MCMYIIVNVHQATTDRKSLSFMPTANSVIALGHYRVIFAPWSYNRANLVQMYKHKCMLGDNGRCSKA